MEKTNFQEFYKKNKVAVIGVPFIIAIVLINNFVLKPSRRAAREEDMPQQAQPARPAQQVAQETTEERPPIVMPDPVRTVSYPKISDKVEERFFTLATYPHYISRNVFMSSEPEPEEIMVVTTPDTVRDEAPDITYHGFFTMNKKPVAILRTPYDLLMAQEGNQLRQTPYRLKNVRPDRVVITEASMDTHRSFEIMLSSATGD